MWQKLFHTPTFKVSIIDDVTGVSLCGALKNVIAIAAGLSDGMGWGNNSKGKLSLPPVYMESGLTYEFSGTDENRAVGNEKVFSRVFQRSKG